MPANASALLQQAAQQFAPIILSAEQSAAQIQTNGIEVGVKPLYTRSCLRGSTLQRLRLCRCSQRAVTAAEQAHSARAAKSDTVSHAPVHRAAGARGFRGTVQGVDAAGGGFRGAGGHVGLLRAIGRRLRRRRLAGAAGPAACAPGLAHLGAVAAVRLPAALRRRWATACGDGKSHQEHRPAAAAVCRQAVPYNHRYLLPVQLCADPASPPYAELQPPYAELQPQG